MRFCFVLTLSFTSWITAAVSQTEDQPFLFPAAGDVLQVGTTYHVFWNALPHKYPLVTLVLRDPESDGLSVSLGHSFINFTNDGFALWTVGPDSLVGQRKFMLGVGSCILFAGGMLIEVGPEDALMNTTRSGVFRIVPPLNSPKMASTSSSGTSGSSSRTHSTTIRDFEVALFLKFQALFGR